MTNHFKVIWWHTSWAQNLNFGCCLYPVKRKRNTRIDRSSDEVFAYSMLTKHWMLHCIQIISYSFQRLLCAEDVTPVVPRCVAPLLPPHRKGMKTMQLAMHKNARSKAHKCRIRHKGFNLGADFGMERVLITNGHLARFPRPIPSAPKIMDFRSYFQSFEMSPDVTVQVHLFGHLNDNSTLPTDASLAGLGEPPFCFRKHLPVFWKPFCKLIFERKKKVFSQLEAEGPTWSLPYILNTLHTSHLDCQTQFDSSWDSFEQKCIPFCFAYIQNLRAWAFLSLFFSLCSLDPLVPHPGISEENLNSHIPHIPHIHTPSSMGRILSGRKWKRQRRQRKNWKNKDIKTSNSRPLLGRPKNWFFCLGMSQHVSTLNTSWLKSWLTEMWLSR